jgi:hypothetical protein
MATKAKRSASVPRHPEKKWGPFHGGVGIAVWLNEVQTDAGPRFFRSISLQPRRYRDKKTGMWKDAASCRVPSPYGHSCFDARIGHCIDTIPPLTHSDTLPCRRVF